MKKILIIFAVLLMLTGCQTGMNSNNMAEGQESPANTATSEESTAASEQGTNQADEQAETQETAAKEAVWSLDVDDTVEVNVEDIKILYTFTLHAVKHGGTTDLGSYTGTASLKQKADASGLSAEMVTVIGGVETELNAENVQIEVIGYDREKYDDFGKADGQNPLTDLSEADGMALGSFTMSGTGKMDFKSFAPYIADARSLDDSSTGEMPYKISIEGGQVSVSIPMLQVPDFHGMLTGTPVK